MLRTIILIGILVVIAVSLSSCIAIIGRDEVVADLVRQPLRDVAAPLDIQPAGFRRDNIIVTRMVPQHYVLRPARFVP